MVVNALNCFHKFDRIWKYIFYCKVIILKKDKIFKNMLMINQRESACLFDWFYKDGKSFDRKILLNAAKHCREVTARVLPIVRVVCFVAYMWENIFIENFFLNSYFDQLKKFSFIFNKHNNNWIKIDKKRTISINDRFLFLSRSFFELVLILYVHSS